MSTEELISEVSEVDVQKEERKREALDAAVKDAAGMLVEGWAEHPDDSKKWFDPKVFENESERVFGLVRKATRDLARSEEIILSSSDDAIENMWRFILEFIARKQHTSSRNRLIESSHCMVNLHVKQPKSWTSSLPDLIHIFPLHEDFCQIFRGDEIVLKDVILKTEAPTLSTQSIKEDGLSACGGGDGGHETIPAGTPIPLKTGRTTDQIEKDVATERFQSALYDDSPQPEKSGGLGFGRRFLSCIRK